MKQPRHKAGQRIKLKTGFAHDYNATKSPPLEHGKPYTVLHHIWTGGKWYVTTVENGPLQAYDEASFNYYESYLTGK